MAKILLIKPPWYVFQGENAQGIPLGLCYIASVLRENGHECLIVDGDLGVSPNLTSRAKMREREGILVDQNHIRNMIDSDHKAWENIEAFIKKFAPNLIGVTATTGMFGAALKAADIAKKLNPEVPVVAGGPHPSCQPDFTLKEGNIDIVVRGEGELTMVNLVNHLSESNPLSEVRGISYEAEDRVFHNPPQPLVEDLDSLPLPARDLILKREKYCSADFGHIMSSRGCPYNCVFCSSNKIWSRKVRYRSPEDILEEIKEVKEKFGTRVFRFNDDIFTLDRERVFKICDLIIEEDLDIEWYCDARVDTLSSSLLQRMKRAGCTKINMGVESGNPEILNRTKKGITLAQARKAIRETKKVGIESLAYFMVGLPGEGKREILDTVRFMEETKPDHVCWSVATPYPGTDLYKIAENKDSLPEDPNWSFFFHHSSRMGVSERLSKEELNDMLNLITQRVNKLYSKPKNIQNYLLDLPKLLSRLKLYVRYPPLVSRDLRYLLNAFK